LDVSKGVDRSALKHYWRSRAESRPLVGFFEKTNVLGEVFDVSLEMLNEGE
jgi:hypothetical protein